MKRLLHPRPVRRVGVATALGFVWGALASLGILAERVTAGSGAVAALLATVTTPLGVLFVLQTQRMGARSAARASAPAGSSSPLFVAQALGLGLGILAVHGAFRLWGDAAQRGLAEVPRQLVNDLGLGLALLLVSWSFVARSRAARLACALAGFATVAAYHLTAASWHADAVPFRGLTVQQYVPEQFGLVAAGLLILFFLGAYGDPDVRSPPTSRLDGS